MVERQFSRDGIPKHDGLSILVKITNLLRCSVLVLAIDQSRVESTGVDRVGSSRLFKDFLINKCENFNLFHYFNVYQKPTISL